VGDPLAGMIWHIAGPPDFLSVRAGQPARVSVLTPDPGSCLAFPKLHHDERTPLVLADLVNGADAWMIQRRSRPRFPSKRSNGC
jgi:hypothetical protein